MVTDDINFRCPRIDVYVLVLYTAKQRLCGNGGRNIDVVELLAIHVVGVGVSLKGIDTSDKVEVELEGGAGEELEGFNESKFVEVAGGNDVGERLITEDLLDEFLD